MSVTEEWEEFVKQSAFRSANTIKSYKNAHKRLTDYIERPIHTAKEKVLINAVEDLATNPNTKSSLLNVATVFVNMFDKPNKQLLKHKIVITGEIEKHRKESADKKSETLPSIATLDSRLTKLFHEEKWRDFIVLWLMMNYNTRNADIDVEIVSSIHETKADKTRNYLVKRRNDFVFIRNNYKTFRTYKQKRHSFKSELMNRAVRYFIAQQPPDAPIYLLNYNGDRMNDGSIANIVKRITGGLTESDINKIQVSEIESIADLPALIQMSERRGTDLKTMVSHYHLTFVKT